MTPTEIIRRFDVEYEFLASAGAPGIESLEKSELLNIATEQLIVNRYNFKSNPQQYGFEETEKRIEDLGELVRYKTYTTFTPGFLPNSTTVELPNTLITSGSTDFSDVAWFIIFEDCITDQLKCDSITDYETPEVKEINHNELKTLLKDPFNQPKAERCIFRNRYEGRKIALITDGNFNVTSYTIGYIRKPQPVDLDNSVGFSNFIPDHLQREIISNAVTLALKGVGDPRYNVYKNELTTIE